jgi:hypothetical protein
MSIIFGEVLFDHKRNDLAFFRRDLISKFIENGAILPSFEGLAVYSEDRRLWSVADYDTVREEYHKLLYWTDGDHTPNGLYPVAEIKTDFLGREQLYSHVKSLHPFIPLFKTKEDQVKFYTFLKNFRVVRYKNKDGEVVRRGRYFSDDMEKKLS